MRHVHHFSGGVEPPLEVDVRLRIGDNLTRDAGRLLASHAEHLNLVGFAIRRIWNVLMMTLFLLLHKCLITGTGLQGYITDKKIV